MLSLLRNPCKSLALTTPLALSSFFVSQGALAIGIDERLQSALKANMEASFIYISASMQGRKSLTQEESAEALAHYAELDRLTSTYLSELSSTGSPSCKAAIEQFNAGPLAMLRQNVKDANYINNFSHSTVMKDSSRYTEELSEVALKTCQE